MIFNKKKKYKEIPTECRGMKVETESSICTGETIIGFRDEKTHKLLYAELVKSQKDIDNFYKKYNIKNN